MASCSLTRRANASASPVRQEATRSCSWSAPLSGLASSDISVVATVTLPLRSNHLDTETASSVPPVHGTPAWAGLFRAQAPAGDEGGGRGEAAQDGEDEETKNGYP